MLQLKPFEFYLLAGQHAPSTARAYLGHITRLAREYPNLFDATTADLEQYIGARRSTHSAESRKSMRSAFVAFYRWAEREHLIDHSPAAALEKIHIPRIVPRLALDDQVLNALIGASVEQRAMVLLGRLACLRLTELTTLHMKQRERDILRIIGKGEKERMVPIHADLLAALIEIERTQPYGYYFPGRFGGSMHPQSVNKIITRITGTNPHSLRHAGATAAYRATRNLRAVQALLGHESLATTQRYLHVELDDIRRAVAGATIQDDHQWSPQRVA